MKCAPLLMSVGSALLLCACQAKAPSAPASADPARIVDAIKTDEVHWNSDWKSGDATALSNHYAANATMMSPGAPPLVGMAAIRAGVQGALEDKAFTLSFSSDKVDVAASGDLAVARGAYTQTATDSRTQEVVTEKGNYVTVYKPQTDGTWKAVWDINTPVSKTAVEAGSH